MKYIIILIIILSFYPAANGQRWAIGLSGSVEKLLINTNNTYQGDFIFNSGSSFNLIAQYDLNKNWFVRSGLGYFSYSFQFNYTYPTYINPNSGIVGVNGILIVNFYGHNNYTESLMEVPVYLGFQTPLSISFLRFYWTLGGSCGGFVNQKYSSNNTSSVQNEYVFNSNSVIINLSGTMGFSFSITPNLLINTGVIFRQGISGADQFGSIGFQLGTTYYLGKPTASK
jgi:hypothetical protein